MIVIFLIPPKQIAEIKLREINSRTTMGGLRCMLEVAIKQIFYRKDNSE